MALLLHAASVMLPINLKAPFRPLKYTMPDGTTVCMRAVALCHLSCKVPDAADTPGYQQLKGSGMAGLH